MRTSSPLTTTLRDVAVSTAGSFGDFAGTALTGLRDLPRATAAQVFTAANASIDAVMARPERIERLATTALGLGAVTVSTGAAIGLTMIAAQTAVPLGIELSHLVHGAALPPAVAQEAAEMAVMGAALTGVVLARLACFGTADLHTVGRQVARRLDEHPELSRGTRAVVAGLMSF